MSIIISAGVLYKMEKIIQLWLFLCLLLMQSVAFAFSCNDYRPIIQKPIIFDDTRINMTRAYQLDHYGINTSSIKIEPKIIVLHWTAYPTLLEAFKAFEPAKLPATRSELPGNLNVSAHFLVDRDGTIYQLMPDNWMARHVIGLNHYAIGIENVGGVDSKPDLTENQAESDAYLVCYLKKKYPTIQYLIGHMDYLNFKGTPLWLEKDPHYQTIKYDPGENFIQRVRALTSNLGLLRSYSH